MSTNALRIKTTANAKIITDKMSNGILDTPTLKDLSNNIISESYQSNRVGSYNNRSYIGLSKQIISELRGLLKMGKISTTPNQFTLDVIFYLLEEIINKFDKLIRIPDDAKFFSIYLINIISIIIFVTVNIESYNKDKARKLYKDGLLKIIILLQNTSIGKYILFNALSITIGENDFILQKLEISVSQISNKKNYAKTQFNKNYSSSNAIISRFQYEKNKFGHYFACLQDKKEVCTSSRRLSSGQIFGIKSNGKSVQPVIEQHLRNLQIKNKKNENQKCTEGWQKYNALSTIGRFTAKRPTCSENLRSSKHPKLLSNKSRVRSNTLNTFKSNNSNNSNNSQ